VSWLVLGTGSMICSRVVESSANCMVKEGREGLGSLHCPVLGVVSGQGSQYPKSGSF